MQLTYVDILLLLLLKKGDIITNIVSYLSSYYGLTPDVMLFSPTSGR